VADRTAFGYHSASSNTWTAKCEVSAVLIWNRDLSDAEMLSILADPYQFLKPVA
jgi:hypothetical protein